MTREELLDKLQEIFDVEEPLKEEMVLGEMDEWDSLVAMALMSYFNNNLSIVMKPRDILEFKTIKNILDKAGL